ncbi:hypothetical protein O3P69_020502 [Scylla paramamosain]|uniref:Uncharacterized protein n=1 Tax=Scylla paramamosain TaxID=85552 RepID=A0AAW0TM07_SCYPA
MTARFVPLQRADNYVQGDGYEHDTGTFICGQRKAELPKSYPKPDPECPTGAGVCWLHCKRLGEVHKDLKGNNITFSGTVTARVPRHRLRRGLPYWDDLLKAKWDLTERWCKVMKRRGGKAVEDRKHSFLFRFFDNGTDENKDVGNHDKKDEDENENQEELEGPWSWVCLEQFQGKPVLALGTSRALDGCWIAACKPS